MPVLPNSQAEGPARLRIAMFSGAAQADLSAHGARVHLDRLAFQLTRMGHSVDLLPAQALHTAGPDYDIAHALTLRAGPAALRLHRAAGLPFVLSMEGVKKTPGQAVRRSGAPSKTVHSYGETAQRRHGGIFHTLMEMPGEMPRWPRTASGVGCDETEAPVLRAASRILSPGPQHDRQLERLFRIAPARIHPALRGFAPEELWPLPMTEARARLGLDQERFLVLHLGRIAPRKGIDTLIQGIALLRRRHAVDAGLLVVGGGPGDAIELARLGQFASGLGIGAHVHFAGAQPRASLRDYYAAANVFAATPWYEPFGMTPLEAMACARPVVASELGGIGELVDEGRSGFLIPSRDPDALAERLARLHRHPGLARAMGEAGRRRACEHHSWRHQAAQLLHLYRAVLRELRQSAHPLAS